MPISILHVIRHLKWRNKKSIPFAGGSGVVKNPHGRKHTHSIFSNQMTFFPPSFWHPLPFWRNIVARSAGGPPPKLLAKYSKTPAACSQMPQCTPMSVQGTFRVGILSAWYWFCLKIMKIIRTHLFDMWFVSKRCRNIVNLVHFRWFFKEEKEFLVIGNFPFSFIFTPIHPTIPSRDFFWPPFAEKIIQEIRNILGHTPNF